MGFFSTIFGFFGFGFGIAIGLISGYYLFIYILPTDVEDPEIKPLEDEDSEVLQRMMHEIPLWIKNPDFDR
ncbi:plant synaptotagmin, partial [Trifolium pratense]